MYHAMPARCEPPSGLSAVSSAPHNFPLAYMTCCIRVSFESGLATTSGPPNACAAADTSSGQQPVPAIVTVVLSFKQRPCGTDVPGAVPEPGWCCFGGMPYWFTFRTLVLNETFGDAEFSDDVFVIVQVTRFVEAPVKSSPD